MTNAAKRPHEGDERCWSIIKISINSEFEQLMNIYIESHQRRHMTHVVTYLTLQTTGNILGRKKEEDPRVLRKYREP